MFSKNYTDQYIAMIYDIEKTLFVENKIDRVKESIACSDSFLDLLILFMEHIPQDD